VQEFQFGRSHIIVHCTLKLSHWSEAPWLLYGMGHSDGGKAREAHRRLLESTCPHPKVQALKAEPLLSQGQLWQQGADLLDDGLTLLIHVGACGLVPQRSCGGCSRLNLQFGF
jgi:hypothetical protein